MSLWRAKVEFWCNIRAAMVTETIGPFEAEDKRSAFKKSTDIAFETYLKGEEFITIELEKV